MAITTLVFDFNRVLIYATEQTAEIPQVSQSEWETALNHPLLNYLQTLPPSLTLHIYSSSLVLQHPQLVAQLQPPFQEIFLSKKLNLSKSHPDSYRSLAATLHTAPENILFVDDQPFNVEAARTAGWNALQFNTNQELFTQLKSQFGIEPATH